MRTRLMFYNIKLPIRTLNQREINNRLAYGFLNIEISILTKKDVY